MMTTHNVGLHTEVSEIFKHKADLHKDVSVIFSGVWNPKRDNLQQSVGVAVASEAAYVHPGTLDIDHLPKESKFTTIIKVFRQTQGHIFSSKSKREKKRLLSISKNLMINMTS
ncbi:MAG: hypothetical protein ACYTFW_14145 [Planctomycetota bacterium]|jgi:hypothetical protein